MAFTSTTLSWDQPFLPQLVGRLLAQAVGKPFDLSGTLMVVPTQQAGRRLRRALASGAREHSTGVLSPMIATPEQLLALATPDGVATPFEGVAAWTVLLQDLDLSDFRDVFPSDPPRRDAAWAASLGQQLSRLQAQLAEHGLDFRRVSDRVGNTDREPERWAALAVLEERWRRLLSARGLADNASSLRSAAATAEPPAGISRIVVASVVDPLPLSLVVLERWAESLPVEIVSHGPVDVVLFDPLGRVSGEAQSSRSLPFREGSALHVTRDSRSASEQAAALAEGYREAPATLAIGAMDADTAQTLKQAFEARGLRAHDPAGVSLGRVGLGLLAVQLLDFVGEPPPASVAQLARHPDFAAFAVGAREWAPHPSLLVGQLDTVLNAHLPGDLAALRTFAEKEKFHGLAALTGWLQALGRRLKSGAVSRSLAEALEEIVAAREFDLAIDEDSDRAEEAGLLLEIFSQFSEVERRFPNLSAPAAALILRRAIESAHRFPKELEKGWDLLGWLELAYEDAPHLVLVGFNEGAVPETIQGDIFLPNSLREFLGMRTNQDRFLRDQLLLEAHLRSRAAAGRVDVLIPRMSDAGDPRQPSRLLFRCSDEELVPRAKQLFAELPPPPRSPARHTAWKLKPVPGTPRHHLSPSSIRTYLACPFRYYLKHQLGMKAVEVGKQELSPDMYGTLCHAALEALGRDPSMREVVDPEKLSAYLTNAYIVLAREQLGVVDSFALQVQLESGLARLQAAARVEAEEREQGWRIVDCERKWALKLPGVEIEGRIDRIDRNDRTGAYRLIDYKTQDAGKPPEQAHWTRYREEDAHVLLEAVFDRGGVPTRWTDLQLPLYLLALRHEFGAFASAGYFVLPKTTQGTRLRLWTELTPEHLAHAEACAVAVGRAIAEGRFWPPAKLKYEDDADYLFPDGIESNVDAEAMLALRKPTGGAA
ncbi:hypothetical protein DB347_19785 [Opitutaceae bacterium EW11]|nr:hypothetical protein DB347_19785 [Opitutaceae bacterium EW11]